LYIRAWALKWKAGTLIFTFQHFRNITFSPLVLLYSLLLYSTVQNQILPSTPSRKSNFLEAKTCPTKTHFAALVLNCWTPSSWPIFHCRILNLEPSDEPHCLSGSLRPFANEAHHCWSSSISLFVAATIEFQNEVWNFWTLVLPSPFSLRFYEHTHDFVDLGVSPCVAVSSRLFGDSNFTPPLIDFK